MSLEVKGSVIFLVSIYQWFFFSYFLLPDETVWFLVVQKTIDSFTNAEVCCEIKVSENCLLPFKFFESCEDFFYMVAIMGYRQEGAWETYF